MGLPCWVGGVLSFGDGDDAPAINVTMRDVRCSMVNFDPDAASPAPDVLKAIVRAPEHRGNLRRGHSHRSTGGRTVHTPSCGDREKGTWVIDTMSRNAAQPGVAADELLAVARTSH